MVNPVVPPRTEDSSTTPEPEWEMAGVFAILCAADLTPELLNRFLDENDGVGVEEQTSVFVDSTIKSYANPPRRPITEFSSPDSPFKGLSTHDCWVLLKEMSEKRTIEPAIEHEVFGILDERSMIDDTMLIVMSPDCHTGQIETVRADFASASLTMPALSIGHIGMDEIQAMAEKAEDGVDRIS